MPQYYARKDIVPCGPSMMSLMKTNCGEFLAKKTKLELVMLKLIYVKKQMFFVIISTYLVLQVQNGNAVFNRVVSFLKCMELAC